jgi:tetratricopeptide (TPR) repeat protein
MKCHQLARAVVTAAVMPVLLLTACSFTPPKAPDTGALWRDDRFLPVALPDEGEILSVSDDMRAYLQGSALRQIRTQGSLRGLVSALEHETQLKLEYDAGKTRTAAEAFAARKGNCLSLTLMTAALAGELGLSVEYHRVLTEVSWDRRHDMLLKSGHVNIVLEPGLASDQSYPRKGLVIDFLPGADLKGSRFIVIDTATVLGMFMNNRAVESLASGDLDSAYAWAKRAIAKAPTWLESYNTLGVIYQRRGMLDTAEMALQAVLSREPENIAALANLAEVLNRSGKQHEASEVYARLQRNEAQPPLFYFDEGAAALKRGEYESAREHFKKELDHNANHAPSYAGLAIANLQLGERLSSNRYMKLAVESAVDTDERQIYSAKLARLKSANSRSH